MGSELEAMSIRSEEGERPNLDRHMEKSSFVNRFCPAPIWARIVNSPNVILV